MLEQRRRSRWLSSARRRRRSRLCGCRSFRNRRSERQSRGGRALTGFCERHSAALAAERRSARARLDERPTAAGSVRLQLVSLGALLPFRSRAAREKTGECDSSEWPRDLSRIRSLHDVAVLSATREDRRISRARDRELARIGRRAGRGSAIAGLADTQRVFSLLSPPANLLSPPGRCDVAVAVAIHPRSSRPPARAWKDRQCF